MIKRDVQKMLSGQFYGMQHMIEDRTYNLAIPTRLGSMERRSSSDDSEYKVVFTTSHITKLVVEVKAE